MSKMTYLITAPLVLTPSQTNVKCNGARTGYAEVAVSGGTPHITGKILYLYIASPNKIK